MDNVFVVAERQTASARHLHRRDLPTHRKTWHVLIVELHCVCLPRGGVVGFKW